jgi:high-affinity nickel permease
LIVGTVELLQVAAPALGLDGGLWDLVRTLDVARLG